jgi:hypothetical protein
MTELSKEVFEEEELVQISHPWGTRREMMKKKRLDQMQTIPKYNNAH